MKSSFLIRLVICAIICLVISIGFQNWIMSTYHLPFLFGVVCFFIIYSFIVHQFALAAAKSANKYAFSRLTLAVSFLKLFIVVGIVVVYRLNFSTESIDFVWPFILIYIAFTIFETSYLLKLAKI